MATAGSVADNLNISEERMHELEEITLEVSSTITASENREPILSEMIVGLTKSGKITDPAELMLVGSVLGKSYLQRELSEKLGGSLRFLREQLVDLRDKDDGRA